MTRPALAAALSLSLSACTVDATPPVAREADACGAAALQSLVGQPATVLQTMRFGAPVRILRPGMAVTMDYSAERLNIAIDRAEVIERVSCG